MTRTPQAFGTPATRLHAGRILLVAMLVLGAALAGWIWLFRGRSLGSAVRPEKSTLPGWTAAQLHYTKPEAKAEVAPAPPVDMTATELARLRAMLAQMQAELDALKNRKPPVATPPPPQPQPPKATPVPKVPTPMLFVHHELKDESAALTVPTYTLAPGAGKLPCIVETAINSDVEGYFTAKISTNVYDTATGRHLLVPQGSTILARDHSLDLLYGNERLPTTSLTLTLPDSRTVDLGRAPVVDQQGISGLTGRVNQHYGRMLAAVLIGGALRGGVQAMQTAMASAAGAGQIAAGYGSVLNQAVSPRLGRALDTRPTIEVDSGSLCHVVLIQPLKLPAMWQ